MAETTKKYSDNFIDVDGYNMPARFYDPDKLRNLAQYNLRKDDLFVTGFPKSGQNWLLLTLRELYNREWGICRLPNGVMLEPMFDFVAMKEGAYFEGNFGDAQKQFLRENESWPSPRMFRGHMPSDFFPFEEIKRKGARVIYVSRNPKDACTSYYHYMKMFLHGEWELSWEELASENFVSGNVAFGPWLKHVTTWHHYGEEDNVLHVKYEDMKTDMAEVLKKIAKFIDRPTTDEAITKALEKTNLKNMTDKNLHHDAGIHDLSKGKFVRKGMVGDWKSYFTVSQNELFDREIVSKLEESGIKFRYE